MKIWPIRPDVGGRSASRSAFDAGGRYLGIPRNGTFSGLTSVQRIRVRSIGTHRLDLAGRTAARRRWRLSFLGARFRGQQHVPVSSSRTPTARNRRPRNADPRGVLAGDRVPDVVRP